MENTIRIYKHKNKVLNYKLTQTQIKNALTQINDLGTFENQSSYVTNMWLDEQDLTAEQIRFCKNWLVDMKAYIEIPNEMFCEIDFENFESLEDFAEIGIFPTSTYFE